MSRFFIFAAVILGVPLLLFLLIFGSNLPTLRSLIDNRAGIAEGSEWVEKTYSLQGLTEYIEEFPDRVSIASITPGQPDSSLFLREKTRRSMGTLSNFFLMIAYADAFELGGLSPSSRIHLEEAGRFQLPATGENLLRSAFEAAEEQGLLDDEGTVALEDAVGLLARHNSPALSDWLLLHLGQARLQQTLEKLRLKQTDAPVPLSGLILTLSPAIHQVSAAQLLEQWRGRSYEALRKAAWEAADAFGSSPELDPRIETDGTDRFGLSFVESRDMLALYPKTTAAEMVRLLSGILEGELISEQVSDRVAGWMRFSMDRRAITRNFTEYGALYDNRMGLLNGIDFGTSRYNGKRAIQAIFFDQLHVAVWMHMSGNHMHQDFLQRMIWDPELFRVMEGVIGNVEAREADRPVTSLHREDKNREDHQRHPPNISSRSGLPAPWHAVQSLTSNLQVRTES